MMPQPARPTTRNRIRLRSRYGPPIIQPSPRFTEIMTTPLLRQAQAIAAGTGGPTTGIATVSFTCTGLGTKWYPLTVVVSTTTGANDGSKASIYLGVATQSSLVNGQRYNGGRDTIGLAIQFLSPGDALIVQWTTAHIGDICTATLQGTQDNLVMY